jgi:predicted transposase/invertase (TIGR01784 family)
MLQSKKPFAPLTLDFMFKRAFATEKNKHILIPLINSFLGEKMEHPIEEVILLNAVQTPKTEELRGAIFDLHCKDSLGSRFIVEMQLAGEKHFIERLLFYTGQTLVNAAERGSEYDYSLPRIYALCFLDFIPKDIGDIGDGSEESIQYISLINEKHREICYKYINIALALLPKFDKTKEKCETIKDWWLYLFTHMHELEEIPQELLELSEIPFKDLFETAKIAKFTKEELEDYEAKMRLWNRSKAMLDYATEEGIAIGEARSKAMLDYATEEGREKGREEVFALLEKGVPLAEAKRQLGLKK